MKKILFSLVTLILVIALGYAAPVQADPGVTVTVELRNSSNDLITNSEATIIYQPGSSGAYVNFGDGAIDEDGTETADVPAGRHRFRLTYQGCTQEKQLWVGEGSIVTYQTHLVTVELLDSRGNYIENSGATIVWQPGSAGSYVAFGDGIMDADGTERMEVLPLSHRFRLTYMGMTQEKQSASVLITYQTGKVVDGGFGCDVYWRSGGPTAAFTDGVQLLPGNFYFKDNDTNTTKNLQVKAGQILNLQTGSYTTNQPPIFDPIGDKTVNEGQLLEFTISANDPDSESLTYSASNLPSGATFDTTTQTFSWTPRHDQAGSYHNVHFEVSDGSLTDSEDITITVANVNQPPVVNPVTVNPSQLWPPNHKAVDVTITVHATDPDGDIVRITYSVADEYGIYDIAETDLPDDGVISLIAWRDGEDKDGRVYTITVTVYDAGGLSDSGSVEVVVPHDQGKRGK